MKKPGRNMCIIFQQRGFLNISWKKQINKHEEMIRRVKIEARHLICSKTMRFRMFFRDTIQNLNPDLQVKQLSPIISRKKEILLKKVSYKLLGTTISP